MKKQLNSNNRSHGSYSSYSDEFFHGRGLLSKQEHENHKLKKVIERRKEENLRILNPELIKEYTVVVHFSAVNLSEKTSNKSNKSCKGKHKRSSSSYGSIGIVINREELIAKFESFLI
eukprot:Pgem_evm1s10179